MSNVIKCSSCGASNQLPEGKSSMFCAFCGVQIEQKIFNQQFYQKKTLVKLKINENNNEIKYESRNIESLDEIIDIYSDIEIENVEYLVLTKNSIKSLKGISRFKNVCSFNFSSNKIISIDELPNVNFKYGDSFELDFSNNENLIGLSDEAAKSINESSIKYLRINLTGCNSFNLDTLSKIDFLKIKSRYSNESYGYAVIFPPDINYTIPDSLKHFGFLLDKQCWSSGLVESKQRIIEEENKPTEFILSTANWFQILAPQFLAILFLIIATDNKEEDLNIFSGLINLIYQFVSLLILPEGNITYFRCLVVANFYILLLMIASILPHEYKVKTGRSFESKHARFDEYKTVKAGPSYVPDNYIYFVILLIHILIIVLYFKLGNHVVSNNNENATSVIDSTNQAPIEVSASSYQESNIDTTANYQNENESIDYSSTDENPNPDNDESMSYSQENESNNDNNKFNSSEIEVKPDFPGGIGAFYKFISNNFIVPDVEGLKGIVTVSFIIEKDGSLSDIKVLKNVGYGTYEEALRVLKKSPRWIPGKQYGNAVRVSYTLDIKVEVP